MKQDIHPQWYPEATVKCACGNTFTVGATKKTMEVEICSACHPFYTGQEKMVDTMGQVERFEERRKKSEQIQKQHTQSKEDTEKNTGDNEQEEEEERVIRKSL